MGGGGEGRGRGREGGKEDFSGASEIFLFLSWFAPCHSSFLPLPSSLSSFILFSFPSFLHPFLALLSLSLSASFPFLSSFLHLLPSLPFFPSFHFPYLSSPLPFHSLWDFLTQQQFWNSCHYEIIASRARGSNQIKKKKKGVGVGELGFEWEPAAGRSSDPSVSFPLWLPSPAGGGRLGNKNDNFM